MKRALNVGLNYPGTRAALRGCVDDALSWKEALGRKQYDAAELLEPTAEQFLRAVRTYVKATGPGDRLVITVSSHGTWKPAVGADHEVDGRDEALVFADFEAGGLVVDDDLARIWRFAHPRARVLLLVDACHSGTVSRFAGFGGQPGSPRFLPPAHFLGNQDLRRAVRGEHLPAAPIQGQQPALISGCRDDQVSLDVDFGGRFRGAFTAAALQALEELGEPSLRTWHRRTLEVLTAGGFEQQPVLTAPLWTRFTRAL